MRSQKEWIIGDDGDKEWLCEHGVGHGDHVHTCDGCCSTENTKSIRGYMTHMTVYLGLVAGCILLWYFVFIFVFSN